MTGGPKLNQPKVETELETAAAPDRFYCLEPRAYIYNLAPRLESSQVQSSPVKSRVWRLAVSLVTTQVSLLKNRIKSGLYSLLESKV